jgi:hypothetical protein
MTEISPVVFKSNNRVFILVALISAVSSVLLTVIWLIIGWRAMKAHEKIASDLSKLVASSQKTELPPSFPVFDNSLYNNPSG